jgi:D-alanine-D-alanine ligase
VKKARRLDILVMFDIGFAPPRDGDYSEYLTGDSFETERCVMKALTGMGHEVRLFGLHDDIHPLIEELRRKPPDLAFNLCEAFDSDRSQEPNVVGLLELMKIRYTGAGPSALRICNDKGLTKKILSYHRIPIPRFVVSRRSRPLRRLRRFGYPAFIKPLGLEASEGIAQMSFADNEWDCLERVRFIHDSLKIDAIIEEYVEGREIYVSLLGNRAPLVFPPRELFFGQVQDGEPKIATFKAKWDESYRKRWGIRSGPAQEIPEATLERMRIICRKIYRLFQITGYARIDLRLRPRGDVVVLEANPNPALGEEDDFAEAAKSAGVGYEDLVRRILQIAQGGGAKP